MTKEDNITCFLVQIGENDLLDIKTRINYPGHLFVENMLTFICTRFALFVHLIGTLLVMAVRSPNIFSSPHLTSVVTKSQQWCPGCLSLVLSAPCKV